MLPPVAKQNDSTLAGAEYPFGLTSAYIKRRGKYRHKYLRLPYKYCEQRPMFVWLYNEFVILLNVVYEDKKKL